ncbi:MAG TPA: hypothetical protein VF575_04195 [Candidatus Saccharimonadales bacterium]|jgi:hypothetical protein
MNPEQNKPPKNNRKLKKILIIVSLIIIAIPLLGYLFIVISFSGGIGGMISDMKSAPNPRSSGISAKRTTAQSDIEAAYNQLQQSTGFKEYKNATYDQCYEGQNNWKVKDGYAHRCDYRVTKYYGFNGDFRQEMLDLERKLFALNWQISNGDRNQLTYYIEEYYDQSYLVSNMPTVIYGYAKSGITMDIAYSERDSEDIFWLESAQDGIGKGFPTYEQKNFIDVKSAFAEVTQTNKYIVAISLEKNYFEN